MEKLFTSDHSCIKTALRRSSSTGHMMLSDFHIPGSFLAQAGRLTRWFLLRATLLLCVLLLGVGAAKADAVAVGTLSFDNLNPTGLAAATFGLDVFNATQPFGGSLITTQLTFSDLSLLAQLSDGTTQLVPLFATDSLGDFSSGQAFVAGDVLSATLMGTFGPLDVTLADGSTATILSTFSTTLTGTSGAPLQDGDLVPFDATTAPAKAVPEPGTLVLLILPMAGLLFFGRKR